MRFKTASNLFHVSEAANLALHAMAAMAADPARLLRTREIAAGLKSSEAHLAKVLSTLEHARLVEGTRGPSGGYRLARPANRIALSDIYEAVEGDLTVASCMFGTPVCGGDRCILGGFFGRVNKQVAAKLRRTRLSDIPLKLGGRRAPTPQDHRY